MRKRDVSHCTTCTDYHLKQWHHFQFWKKIQNYAFHSDILYCSTVQCSPSCTISYSTSFALWNSGILGKHMILISWMVHLAYYLVCVALQNFTHEILNQWLNIEKIIILLVHFPISVYSESHLTWEFLLRIINIYQTDEKTVITFGLPLVTVTTNKWFSLDNLSVLSGFILFYTRTKFVLIQV